MCYNISTKQKRELAKRWTLVYNIYKKFVVLIPLSETFTVKHHSTSVLLFFVGKMCVKFALMNLKSTAFFTLF